MTATLPLNRAAAAAAAHPAGSAASAGTPVRSRYLGVDLARLLAIVGMMATHLVVAGAAFAQPGSFDAVAADVARIATSGIAAPLFAVLGGVSAVFATRRLLAEGRTGAAMGAVALRGAILILIGLLLGMVVSPVVVVLAYYGLAMILLAPLVAVRGPILVALAVVIGVASGPLNALARHALGIVNEGGSVTFEALFAQPVESLRGLALTGEYPAATWVVYLIAGLLIGRLLITANARGALARVAGILAAAGAGVAVVAQLVSTWALANLELLGFTAPAGLDPAMMRMLLEMPSYGAPVQPDVWAQLVATPHTGSAMDLIRTTAIACAVIGLLVLLLDGRRADRAPGAMLGALRAAGAAPLTVYVLHIVATGFTLGAVTASPELAAAGAPWWAVGVTALGLQFAGVLALGAVLSATGLRGPLEAATSRIVGLAVKR